MDDIERWAKLAGMVDGWWNDSNNTELQEVFLLPEGNGFRKYAKDDPALLPLIAEILKAKVRNMNDGSGHKKEPWRKYIAKLNELQNQGGSFVPECFASAEQVCRAAEEVLNG